MSRQRGADRKIERASYDGKIKGAYAFAGQDMTASELAHLVEVQDERDEDFPDDETEYSDDVGVHLEKQRSVMGKDDLAPRQKLVNPRKNLCLAWFVGKFLKKYYSLNGVVHHNGKKKYDRHNQLSGEYVMWFTLTFTRLKKNSILIKDTIMDVEGILIECHTDSSGHHELSFSLAQTCSPADYYDFDQSSYTDWKAARRNILYSHATEAKKIIDMKGILSNHALTETQIRKGLKRIEERTTMSSLEFAEWVEKTAIVRSAYHKHKKNIKHHTLRNSEIGNPRGFTL